MADHKFHAVGGKLVGNRNALFRIGRVVSVGNDNFLSEDAAGCVDVGGSLVDAILHLRAGRRAGTRNRTADGEFDLGRGCSGRGYRKAQHEAERGNLFHLVFPSNCQPAHSVGQYYVRAVCGASASGRRLR